MTHDRHWVAGFFGDRAQALNTQIRLTDAGIPLGRSQVYDNSAEGAVSSPHPPANPPPEPGSDVALKDMLVDGAIGTAVGAGLGALAQVAIVAGNVSLFVASPVLAPLAMLGWGASLGGTVGALVGAEKKTGPLSALVRDAVASGQSVLVVETHSPEETTLAQSTMRTAVGEIKDVVTKDPG